MKRILLFLALVAGTVAGFARVQLPGLYTSHMVLQQQSSVTLHAKAKPNKRVTMTASWDNTPIIAQADAEGRFSMTFSTPIAGGPYTLCFSDGQKTVLEDVLVGEVWLGSGQSNMEMPVAGWGKIKDYEQEIAAADYPMIRLYQVKRETPSQPIERISSTLDGWQPCSPTTVPEFSALGYCFARELYQHLNVPVGIINSSWGGTPAETWTSQETVGQVQGFQEEMAEARQLGFDSVAMRHRYDSLYALWLDKSMSVDRGGKGWEQTTLDESTWSTMHLPDPFDRAALPDFDGVVWYRKHINIPAAWADKPMTLNLGCIDDEDRTYINGQLLTTGSGWQTPRHYQVPAGWLHEGDNVLVVRVLDSGGGGGLLGPEEDMSLVCQKESKSLKGDWLYRVGCAFKELPVAPVSPFNPPYPGCLFNGMIAPITSFPVKGIIWYQGCNNVGRAWQYKALFPAMISDWRKQFGNAELPFYFVQLANYLTPSDLQPGSDWAALREAQDAALALPNTYRMVNIDLGEAYDIHPKNKQEVARRLALLALHNTYNQDLVCCAPEYAGYTIVGNKVIISLSYPNGAGVLVDQDNVSGFILQGPDGTWHIAQAKVTNGIIEVWCDDVPYPVAVRYGWADNPTCTLQTKDGLHLAPFRTDRD